MAENDLHPHDDLLRRIFYDPSHPAGFSSAEKLLKAVRDEGIRISLDSVKDWLSGEITYTLHRQARRRWKRNKILVSSVDEQWQADLTFLKDFVNQNDGYRYVLTIIDCLSKYAWAVPLKNKKEKGVVEALKEIFKTRKPHKFQTDQGREFDNRAVKNLLKENDVHYFTANNPDIKCSMVERFNRTLKGKMFKYFTAKGTRKWYDVLPNFLEAYNNTKHRTTKFKPIDVKTSNQHIVFENIYGVKSLSEYFDENPSRTAKVSPGDNVRMKYQLKAFDRGYYPNWTDRVYTIKDNIKGEKPLHKLNEDESRRFYPEEVQKIKNSLIYRIQEIIDRREVGRGRNKRTEYLVSWIGYPDSENSWIPAENVTEIA